MNVTPQAVLVTGVGACLPSLGDLPITDAEELWELVRDGRSTLGRDDLYFGQVRGLDKALHHCLPELTCSHLNRYSTVHKMGLVSMLSALDDAGLAWRHGACGDAGVLTGRSGVDTIVQSYTAAVKADPDHLDPAEAKELFMRLALSGTVTDLGGVQASLLGSAGPCYCLSCGCASSAVAIGEGFRLVRDGEIDVCIVTGADAWDLAQTRHLDRLREAMRSEIRTTSFTEPVLRMDELMRPYDKQSRCFNMGDGATTLVLESARHASRRGVRPYARLVGQATRRSAGHSALATAGLQDAVVRATRAAVVDIPLDSIAYVNGAAQGDDQFNRIESEAITQLFGSGPIPLVSCQEATFGHIASALGGLGAAVCGLALRHGQVPPTACCETPDPELSFDPVPGNTCREVPSMTHVSSINYQVGGVASAMLLEAC